MDYSERIRTNIDALRHYLLAQADDSNLFVSLKERNAGISELLSPGHRTAMFLEEGSIPVNQSLSGFLKRFVPYFTIGFDSEQMDTAGLSCFKPPFQIAILSDPPADNKLSILPEDRHFLEKAEHLARIACTFGKFESNDNGICIAFDASEYIAPKRNELLSELLQHSTVFFGGKSIVLTGNDRSPELERLLMDAVMARYPKNVDPADINSAMVHVIHASDTERGRILLSDRGYFTELFSSWPYCWTRQLINAAWQAAINEEILLPEMD